MNYEYFPMIGDHRKEEDYPDPKLPEIATRFKSLSEYLKVAERVIRKFCPKETASILLKNEDAISEVARNLMNADWQFKGDKGRTEHSWRNQRGKWAVQDYLDFYYKQNKVGKADLSLDYSVGDGETSLSSLTKDVLAKEPGLIVAESERRERVRNYISLLMETTKLSKPQRRCLELRYFEDIECYKTIADKLEPKISRQGVKQLLDRSLFKLKQTALGTMAK